MRPGEAMQRPAGITVLAVLHFVLAAVVLVAGALWIWAIGVLSQLAEQGITYGAELPPSLSHQFLLLVRLGRLVGVILLLVGGVKAVIGVGLWKLRNWGRLLTLIVAALSVLLALPGIVTSLRAGAFFGLGFGLLVAVGYAMIIWYLLQPPVKRAFGVA